MTRCLNPRCARELQDDWAFCDLCGRDNRPPSARVRVEEDEHLAPHGEFCVRCGVSILDLNDPADEDENRLYVWGGWAALVAGGISLCVSMAIRPSVRSRRGEEPSAAVQWAYLGARYGSYLLAAGIILLLVTPALKRRR